MPNPADCLQRLLAHRNELVKTAGLIMAAALRHGVVTLDELAAVGALKPGSGERHDTACVLYRKMTGKQLSSWDIREAQAWAAAVLAGAVAVAEDAHIDAVCAELLADVEICL